MKKRSTDIRIQEFSGRRFNPDGGFFATNQNEIELTVRSRYTHLMFKQMIPGLWVALFLAGLLCSALWDVTDHQTIVIWFSIITVLTIVRTIVILLYRRNEITNARSPLWERLVSWPHCIAGLVWGVGCLIMMPTNSVEYQALIHCYMVGLSCGSTAVYPGQTLIKSLTVLCFILPVSGWFFFFGTFPQVTLAIAAWLLALFLIQGMASQSQLLRDTLQMAGELEVAKSMAEIMARTDALTGLNNRRAFSEIASALLSQANRQGISISTAMLDIDNFKKINDNYGHETGDAALRHVAKILQDNIRSSDICGRLGGEEFAIILPGSNLEETILVIEKIRELISSTPFTTPKGIIYITGSFGVSCGSSNLGTLLQKADAALYEAKKTGRNKVIGKAS